MNYLTLLIIHTRGDDIKCSAGGPSKDTGKYMGWITLFSDGEYDRELVNTSANFDTATEATKCVQDIVDLIRSKPLEYWQQQRDASCV